jgi:hypothetical protein
MQVLSSRPASAHPSSQLSNLRHYAPESRPRTRGKGPNSTGRAATSLGHVEGFAKSSDEINSHMWATVASMYASATDTRQQLAHARAHFRYDEQYTQKLLAASRRPKDTVRDGGAHMQALRAFEVSVRERGTGHT